MRSSLGLSFGPAASGGYTALTPPTFDFDPRYGIRFGTALLRTGTGTPAVTITAGTRDRTATQLLSGGIRFTILPGAATMNVSFDNGATNVASGVPIPAGSTYTPPGANSDLTFTFQAGTYVANDVYDITVERWTDQVAGYFVSQTANVLRQPRYFVTGLSGKPYLQFDGVDDRLDGTDATVCNVFKDNAVGTLIQRFAAGTPNSIRVAFSACNTAQSVNGSRRFGTDNVSGGVVNSTWTNDAATAKVSDGATALGTGAHTALWKFDGGAGTLSCKLDGAAETITNATSNSPGTLTANRVTFGCRNGGSSPATFWDGKIGRTLGFAQLITDDANQLANL